MKIIGDLHIHSRFSMATSKEGTPENLDFWARKKGISLIGTGDFTHPAWRAELRERLIPEGNGLYRLKEEYVKKRAGSSQARGHDLLFPEKSALFIRRMERPEKYTM